MSELPVVKANADAPPVGIAEAPPAPPAELVCELASVELAMFVVGFRDLVGDSVGELMVVFLCIVVAVPMLMPVPVIVIVEFIVAFEWLCLR